MRPARRHDLDALRGIAVILLLLYHCARPFDLETWHIKSETRSVWVQVIGQTVTPWRLPLLFLLAGMGTALALHVRSPGAFLRERVRRVLVPLVFGILVIVPPQVYVERISHDVPMRLSPHNFDGSYLEFLPHAFLGMYPEGNLSWHHLWFLAYILVFAVVGLPIFLALRRATGDRLIASLADWLSPGRRLLLLAAPLIALDIALRGRFPTFQNLVSDWANSSHSFLLVLYGSVLISDERFGAALERNRRLALWLAVGLTLLRMGLALWGVRAAAYTLEYGILTALRTAQEWTALVAILGYASVHLRRPNRAFAYLSEILTPFYVLHQTIIVMLAAVILPWSPGVGLGYLTLVVGSLACTLVLSEGARRTSVTRFLFGIKRSARRSAHGRPVLRLRET